MATTNAERQKTFRAKRKQIGPDKEGDRNLNVWMSASSAINLRFLVAVGKSKGKGEVTRQSIVEKLVNEEATRIKANMELEQIQIYSKPKPPRGINPKPVT